MAWRHALRGWGFGCPSSRRVCANESAERAVERRRPGLEGEMADPHKRQIGTVAYASAGAGYFENRLLRRYAGVWSLRALGVGAVISGHFSGWNLGLANGWGSMLLATIIISVMYLGLTFSLAEMS